LIQLTRNEIARLITITNPDPVPDLVPDPRPALERLATPPPTPRAGQPLPPRTSNIG
jgi:hypothetical protein